MKIKLDCRHFPGDRPCSFHKETGIRCDECHRYDPPGKRILIVKLDALGDVLRTTSLLPSLKRAWKNSHVTWLTAPGAIPLLAGHPMIDEILATDAAGIARLHTERFDLILNPDASKASGALATMAAGDELRGYCIDDRGNVRPANLEAIEWLEMGGRDDLKRKNRLTYQEHLHRICKLDPAGQEITVHLEAAAEQKARRFAARAGIDRSASVVGFNTGSSPRWPLKRWGISSWLDLALRIRTETDLRVILLGGEGERERNAWLVERTGGWLVDSGAGHSLPEFFAHVDLCDLLVTGDTLALHAALGLKKRVVALFGPTSPWEIDLYGRGRAIYPDMDCIACYLNACELSPNCMDRIEVSHVYDAVLEELKRAGRGAALASAAR